MIAAVCPTGKMSYPSQVAAHRAADSQAKRNRGPRGDAYRCPECDAWHLTRMSRNDADGMKLRARRRGAA